jgi:hypothetical protein
MESSFFFDTITVGPSKEKIYKRLGYRRRVTLLQPREEEEIDRNIEDAFDLIHLAGAAVPLAIEKKGSSEIILSTGERIKSKNLARLLHHSESILLLGATAGRTIMEAVKDDLYDRTARSVVLDAAASEMVDGALDWMVAYFNQSLRRKRRKPTKRRFSCGYGDFDLSYQRWIFETLGMDRLGVRLTESCLLVPEKSVTAVAGIERIM